MRASWTARAISGPTPGVAAISSMVAGANQIVTLDGSVISNTMTVNGNVVVTGTVAEAAVSEGPLTITGGTVTVKDLKAQTQTSYTQEAAGAAILERLRQRG